MGAELAAQFCRIERWRGYRASSFYAFLPDRTVLESPAFRWRRAAAPPDEGAARAAYQELVGRLEDAGWMHHADGTEWFATTFTRLVERTEAIAAPPPVDVVRAHLPPEVAPAPPVPVVSRPPEPPREPPAPARSAVRAPQPAEARPAPPRRRARIVAAALAALVAAAVAGASVVLLGGHRSSDKPAAAPGATVRRAMLVPPATTSPAAEPRTTTRSAAPVPVKASLVDLRIAAHGNGSWVEVRRTSATGPVLYQATLTDGQKVHLRGPKLWARLGAASNLTITSNGVPIHLEGTYEKLFVVPH